MKSILTIIILFVFTMLIGIPHAEADINDGLVLHYNFDEDNGTTIIDQSGHGNHGVINGATYVSDGVMGGAYDFDGVDDSIRSSGSVTSETMTVSMWVYEDTRKAMSWDPAYAHVLYSVNMGGYNEISSSGGSICYGMTPAWTNSGVELPLATWTHFAFVMEPGALFHIYRNGVNEFSTPVGSFNAGLLPINLGLWFRGDGYGTDRGWFDGKIDEVRVYNRALSADEVLALFNNNEEPVPVDGPWLQKLGFSNTPNGPWDVTEFLTDETLYVRLEDVDVEADSATLRTRVHVTQPQRTSSRIRTDVDKRTRVADRTRPGSTIFELEPQEDGTLMGSMDLSLLKSGYTYVTVTVMDTDGHYVYQRRSNIFISSASGAAPPPTAPKLDTRRRIKR